MDEKSEKLMAVKTELETKLAERKKKDKKSLICGILFWIGIFTLGICLMSFVPGEVFFNIGTILLIVGFLMVIGKIMDYAVSSTTIVDDIKNEIENVDFFLDNKDVRYTFMEKKEVDVTEVLSGEATVEEKSQKLFARLCEQNPEYGKYTADDIEFDIDTDTHTVYFSFAEK